MILTVADVHLENLQTSLGLGLPYTVSDLELMDLKDAVPNPTGSLLSIADFQSALRAQKALVAPSRSSKQILTT